VNDAGYLGLNIGGTKCSAVVGTASGQILDRREWPSRATRGPQPMLEEAMDGLSALLSAHPDVRALGVAVGGPLDADRGIVFSPPNLPGWDAIPLKALLEARFPMAVRVEHDAAACALAEHRWGAAKGLKHVAYVTCGTGFGVGLVLNGQVYHGAMGRNCEIGHIRYRDDGPEAFGKRGSIEAYCAAAALGRLAAWLYPERFPDPPTPPEIARLAEQRDPEAQQVVRTNARAVGHVCALLGDLLWPEMIVLGSLAHYLGPSWIRLVREAFLEEAMHDVGATCRLEPAGLGPRLQDCSALAAAMCAVPEIPPRSRARRKKS